MAEADNPLPTLSVDDPLMAKLGLGVLSIVNEALLFLALRNGCSRVSCYLLESSAPLGNIATGDIFFIFRIVQFMAWHHPYELKASSQMAFDSGVAITNFNFLVFP